MATDKQSKKWLLTINNPQESGWGHEKIKMSLATMKPVVYYCMSDEIAPSTDTHHTHVYIHCKTPVRFSTVKNKFPTAHIDLARGTAEQNRNYVFKMGEKYEGTEKEDSRIDGTQEEWGEFPDEHQGKKPEMSFLLELIQSGMSDYEIITQFPDYLFDTDKLARVRLILKQEEFKTVWRNLEVTYIYGKTGTGKSRFVMEKYGYENVFRVTDYVHPFDTYNGEEVLMLEEFNSSIRMQDLLNYLDGYPLKLPARYSDKIACFTKVYFTTNICLQDQYPNVRQDTPQVWAAFLRRINKVMWFKSETNIFTYDSMDEYNNRDRVTGFKVEYLDF